MLATASWMLALGAASGATSPPPSATTGSATLVTDTTATVSGTVNPNGQQTVYAFQYGPTSSYGHQVPVPPATVGSGTTAMPVGAALTGLVPGTTYHYRVIATSDGGVATGADQTFKTTGTAPAASTPPTATTGTASDVAGRTATLHGTVNPNGQSTSYWFEYGTTPDYGFESAPASAGSGTANVAASATPTALPAGSTIHFRIVAESPGGTTLGSDQTFTTAKAPSATTGNAGSITANGAIVNGTVNPNSQTTTYYFQFGPTTSYGLQSTPAGAGAGTGDVAVKAQLTGLQPATTYHYRLVATNASGTSFGADQAFKTAAAAPVVSRLALFGHTAFIAPQGVGGIFVGCLGSTPCSGSMTVSRNGVTLGRRHLFFVAANDGGIVHFTFSASGEAQLKAQHRLAVEVVVHENGGNTASKVVTLVPFT